MKLYLKATATLDEIDALVTLYFEFSPSGLQFDPSAILQIQFELLLTEDKLASLVITDENGNDIDGTSYDIDDEQKRFLVYLPHFSYYCFRRR
jgi:hypothetical protein